MVRDGFCHDDSYGVRSWFTQRFTQPAVNLRKTVVKGENKKDLHFCKSLILSGPRGA